MWDTHENPYLVNKINWNSSLNERYHHSCYTGLYLHLTFLSLVDPRIPEEHRELVKNILDLYSIYYK